VGRDNPAHRLGLVDRFPVFELRRIILELIRASAATEVIAFAVMVLVAHGLVLVFDDGSHHGAHDLAFLVGECGGRRFNRCFGGRGRGCASLWRGRFRWLTASGDDEGEQGGNAQSDERIGFIADFHVCFPVRACKRKQVRRSRNENIKRPEVRDPASAEPGDRAGAHG
jgi:hypothetical protein